MPSVVFPNNNTLSSWVTTAWNMMRWMNKYRIYSMCSICESGVHHLILLCLILSITLPLLILFLSMLKLYYRMANAEVVLKLPFCRQSTIHRLIRSKSGRIHIQTYNPYWYGRWIKWYLGNLLHISMKITNSLLPVVIQWRLLVYRSILLYDIVILHSIFDCCPK